MNHNIGRLVFAVGVGAVVAFMAFRWITNPAPRMERQLQETAVLAARQQLPGATGIVDPEIVDPLAPDRKVGKVYIYRTGDGWEVSGYYRRDDDDRWHPFLMTLDASNMMSHLKLQDAELVDRAAQNELVETLP